MEIERKFLVKKLPDNIASCKKLKIEQGYLCRNPILRIRKSNEDYYLTYKSKNGCKKRTGIIAREEVELPLSGEAYDTLKGKIEGNMVCKTRYLIPIHNGLTAELDIFEGLLTGLMMVEVEFASKNEACAFVPPDWFGKDVSDDIRYSNYYMSTLSSIKEYE
jgi:CYTH domain-containing protein